MASGPQLRTERFLADNGHGWRLGLYQTWDEARVDHRRKPVLIVPGYGMNSYIFSFHPSGPSLEGYLAARGFEVWRVDLRAQGSAERAGGSDQFSLEDLALTDLTIAVDTVLANTRGQATRVDLLGASLGGTLMFIHAVLNQAHKLGTLVSLGSPVRWVDIHPLIRIAFASPFLVGQVRLKGTRKFAELALPQLVRFTPWLLKIYLNPDITDTKAARDMLRTVEDPNRFINRQIAAWVRDRDLIIRGTNIAQGLGRISQPLLTLLAEGDGIVPPKTAAFAHDHVASKARKLVAVGDRSLHVAHADLFVSSAAQEHVFAPVSDWLLEHA